MGGYAATAPIRPAAPGAAGRIGGAGPRVSPTSDRSKISSRALTHQPACMPRACRNISGGDSCPSRPGPLRPGSGPARLGPLWPGNCLALLPLQRPGIAAMTSCTGRPGALQHNSGVLHTCCNMSGGDSGPARPGSLRTSSAGPSSPYNCPALLPIAPARAAAVARAWLSAAAAEAAASWICRCLCRRAGHRRGLAGWPRRADALIVL